MCGETKTRFFVGGFLLAGDLTTAKSREPKRLLTLVHGT
jgi:hypothetical protein